MNQAFKQRLGPGVWIDQDDNMHFSVPELMKMFDLPPTPENEAAMRTAIDELIRESKPDADVIHQSGCPSCGTKGFDHAPTCPVGGSRG